MLLPLTVDAHSQKELENGVETLDVVIKMQFELILSVFKGP